MSGPRVPSPVAGVDVLSLPLSTQEGFVLSRVDGTSSVEDISIMSGIAQHELLSILDRLHDLGAVQLSWRPAPAKPAGAAPTAARPQPGATPVNAPRPKPTGAPFAHPRPDYDEGELDETVDLSMEVRRRILDAFYALEGRTHYELLGVEMTAEKQDIRTAYFELSKLFHPDSQFGKKMGSFQSKMEAVFKALTDAYEVLSRKNRRAQYDDYLRTTASTRQTAASLRESQQAFEAVRQSRSPSEMEPEPVDEPPGPAPGERRPPPANPLNQMTPAERRARVRNRVRDRLKGVTGRAPETPKPAAPASAPSTEWDPVAGERRKNALDDLRRSLKTSGEVSGGGTPDQRLSRHLANAKDAEREGDFLRASHEIQQALLLSPDDAMLTLDFKRLSQLVQRGLADNYEKQARYEESEGKWAAAAASWARVADGRPDDHKAAVYAAECLLKADGDLHLAQKYAQRAVKAKPRNVGRITLLARVYLAAGLKLNAVRELEKAVKLAPRDEMVKNLLREAQG